jgi:signal transduction histidine kinase
MLTGEVFELAIEDNGRGFDRGEMRKKPGRGVANIRARASMIDGEVEWSKRDGGGTVFRMSKKEAGAGHEVSAGSGSDRV